MRALCGMMAVAAATHSFCTTLHEGELTDISALGSQAISIDTLGEMYPSLMTMSANTMKKQSNHTRQRINYASARTMCLGRDRIARIAPVASPLRNVQPKSPRYVSRSTLERLDVCAAEMRPQQKTGHGCMSVNTTWRLYRNYGMVYPPISNDPSPHDASKACL